MNLEWTFTAETYLDQLPPEERAKVLHVIERLPTEWDSLGAPQLQKLSGAKEELYSLRVGADLRVVFRRQANVIIIVDVVRRSQIDGLRRIGGANQAASG